MNKVKVIKVENDCLLFEGNIMLSSNHDQDCCENHYLSFEQVTMSDFEGLEFDLTSDSFFKKIPDYGIELVPKKGWSVKIPGYGSNNGYYSSELTLVLSDGKSLNKEFDISECQVITD